MCGGVCFCPASWPCRAIPCHAMEPKVECTLTPSERHQLTHQAGTCLSLSPSLPPSQPVRRLSQSINVCEHASTRSVHAWNTHPNKQMRYMPCMTIIHHETQAAARAADTRFVGTAATHAKTFSRTHPAACLPACLPACQREKVAPLTLCGRSRAQPVHAVIASEQATPHQSAARP